MRLYLASTSPARLQLLRNAGIEPIPIAPGVDEAKLVSAHEAAHGKLTPTELVQLLARAKAEALLNPAITVTQQPIDGLIIGGDSIFLTPAGTIQGKPHLPELARTRWRAQNGGSGQLWSGHWLIDHRKGQVNAAVGRAAVAEVKFARLEPAEIDAYVASGEPLLVAGAFTIDSLGGPFIREIIGDPSTVVGLSLSTLRELVLELGLFWPALWRD